MVYRTTVILIFGILVFSGSVVVGKNERNGGAPVILKKMAETYGSAATYADNGVVVTTHETTGEVERQPFSIAFKRPDIFHFEWIDYSITDRGTKGALWWHGKETFTYTESGCDEFKGESGASPKKDRRPLVFSVRSLVVQQSDILTMVYPDRFPIATVSSVTPKSAATTF